MDGYETGRRGSYVGPARREAELQNTPKKKKTYRLVGRPALSSSHHSFRPDDGACGRKEGKELLHMRASGHRLDQRRVAKRDSQKRAGVRNAAAVWIA